MKRKYYLIDTENVGDRWFTLPQKIKDKDRIITFYTRNHSKHLEKYLTKQVHNPKILWLECTAGTNALDYQLIGVLSYLIAKHPKASYFIFSNDKDYQPTVDFWKSRGILVCQKKFIIEEEKKSKKKKGKKKKEKKTELQKGLNELTDEQYVTEIAKSLPVNNLDGWYQSLVSVLGQEKGRIWYLKLKEDAEFREKLSEYYMEDEDKRGVHLIATVLKSHQLETANADDAYKIICSHNRKNIKAIREDFDKRFGKKPPQRYLKVLRPLIRIIKGK